MIRKNPIRVAVTGAAGQIGYSLLPRIARGDIFGHDQKVALRLLEIPQAMKTLEGVVMELEDCAFPTLASIELTDDPNYAFEKVNWALLVGARPRSKGMERKDLLAVNAPIFLTQGKALNEHASTDVRIVVVGNPANTNALIAARNAPDIPKERFSAMTRLDHNRAITQLAKKLRVSPDKINKMVIWGNHSNTMVPDISFATVKGKPVTQLVQDEWYMNEFLPQVVNRGAAVIEARGASSALSAANAIIDHVRDLFTGTPAGTWSSMAVWSKGSYGAPKNVFFSFPCVCKNGTPVIVEKLKISNDTMTLIQKTGEEILLEKRAVSQFLPK